MKLLYIYTGIGGGGDLRCNACRDLLRPCETCYKRTMGSINRGIYL